MEGLEAEEAAIVRNQRVNIGLSGLFSQHDREEINNLYNHAAHSASNSIQGLAGSSIRGVDLGLSLGVNLGSINYNNRTGNQQ